MFSGASEAARLEDEAKIDGQGYRNEASRDPIEVAEPQRPWGPVKCLSRIGTWQHTDFGCCETAFGQESKTADEQPCKGV